MPGGLALGIRGLPPELASRLAAWFGATLEAPSTKAGFPGSLVTVVGVPTVVSETDFRPPRTIRIQTADSDRWVVGKHEVKTTRGRAECCIEFAEGHGVTAAELEGLFIIALIHQFALHGRVTIHGCAFKCDGRSVLGVGRTRSGKSTISATAISRGGRVVSDDLLLVSKQQGDGLLVHALRPHGLIRAPTVDILPKEIAGGLRPSAAGNEGKWILPRQSHPSAFIDQVKPGVLWLLSIDRRLNQSRIEPVSQSRAMAGLMLSTSSFLLAPRYPVERSRVMPVLTEIATSCRSFQVRLGKDLLKDPGAALHRLLVAGTDSR